MILLQWSVESIGIPKKLIPHPQLQHLELLHHYNAPGIKTLQEGNMEFIPSDVTLKSSGSTFALITAWIYSGMLSTRCSHLWSSNFEDQWLWGSKSFQILTTTPFMLLRQNVSIFLQNHMLHICLSVLNCIETRRIWRVCWWHFIPSPCLTGIPHLFIRVGNRSDRI